MKCIWQDITVNLTSSLSSGKVTYRIYQAANCIYEGTAYADTSGNCIISIRDIIKDSLSRDVYCTDEEDMQMLLQFSVSVNGVTVWDDVILNCWDYKTILPTDFEVEEYPPVYLSTMLKGDWVSGQPQPQTVVHSFDSETEEYGYVEQADRGETTDFNQDGLLCRKRNVCDPHVLLYVCPKGGWSWFLLEGAKPTEVYTRQEYAQGNTREEYAVKVQEGWDCYTGRFPRPERIGELIGSPEVYMWTTDGAKKVIITDTKAVGTSYKQNGRKPVEFTIHVDLAERRERR